MSHIDCGVLGHFQNQYFRYLVSNQQRIEFINKDVDRKEKRIDLLNKLTQTFAGDLDLTINQTFAIQMT
ncbi:CLUMA_CG010848, isoform A [Clunio marinus]|uniref:CLUMA_CG010848, isoform A n=1 Tax=Clunio marinus TaxID=568069 RepID=A0A1J1IB73_9DIPT|nr:CLUMA_CG010848, isoform A [Clunio marinus]